MRKRGEKRGRNRSDREREREIVREIGERETRWSETKRRDRER